MRLSLAIALHVCLLLAAQTTNADAGEAPAFDPVLRDVPLPSTYGEAMASAADLARDGQLGLACDYYFHAFRLQRTPRAALAMLDCSMELGDFLRARDVTDTLHRDFMPQLTRDERAHVARQQQLAERQLAAVEFQVTPQQATVVVDGIVWSRRRQFLLPGHHTYAVDAPDHALAEGTLQVAAGETKALPIVLHPTTNAGRETGRLLDAAIPPSRVMTTEGGLEWTWVALGSTVVFAGASVLSYALAESELSDFEKVCGNGMCTEPLAKAWLSTSPGETYEVLTNVSLGLSIVSAVTTCVLLVVEWPREVESDGVASIRLGPGSVRLDMQF